MGIEIEKKFLVGKFPTNEINNKELTIITRKRITQNYLAVGNEEVRIRKMEVVNKKEENTEFLLTIKKGKGLVRTEDEFNISEQTYNQLLYKTPLIKERYKLLDGKYVYDLDVYSDFDFVTVEVEFENENSANSFKAPNWFSDEVTDNSFYKNQNLWQTINEKSKKITNS